jgi:hypothetical protein
MKSLYIFRTLFAYPQEVLHKQHECSENAIVAQPSDITRTQYTKCRL